MTDDNSAERRLDGTDVSVPIKVAADAPLGPYTLRLRARSVLGGRTVELRRSEIQYKWDTVGKVSGPIEDQQLVATIAELHSGSAGTCRTLSLCRPGNRCDYGSW